MAVALLPQAYDWRTMSISQLLYPRVNPQYHFIPATGIAVSGVLLFPFGSTMSGGDSALTAPMVRRRGFAARCDLRDPGQHDYLASRCRGRATVPKLHEVLGQASGIGLGVGILLFEFYALGQRRTEDDSVSRRLVIWWSFITWPAVILVILRLRVVEAHLQALRSFTPEPQAVHGLAPGVLGMDWSRGGDRIPDCFGVASTRGSGQRCLAIRPALSRTA